MAEGPAGLMGCCAGWSSRSLRMQRPRQRGRCRANADRDRQPHGVRARHGLSHRREPTTSGRSRIRISPIASARRSSTLAPRRPTSPSAAPAGISAPSPARLLSSMSSSAAPKGRCLRCRDGSAMLRRSTSTRPNGQRRAWRSCAWGRRFRMPTFSIRCRVERGGHERRLRLRFRGWRRWKRRPAFAIGGHGPASRAPSIFPNS